MIQLSILYLDRTTCDSTLCPIILFKVYLLEMIHIERWQILFYFFCTFLPAIVVYQSNTPLRRTHTKFSNFPNQLFSKYLVVTNTIELKFAHVCFPTYPITRLNLLMFIMQANRFCYIDANALFLFFWLFLAHQTF